MSATLTSVPGTPTAGFVAGLPVTAALSFLTGFSVLADAFFPAACDTTAGVFADVFAGTFAGAFATILADALLAAGLLLAFVAVFAVVFAADFAGFADEAAGLVAVFATGLAALATTAPAFAFDGRADFVATGLVATAFTFLVVLVAAALPTVFVFVCVLALAMSIPVKWTIRNPENLTFYQNMTRQAMLPASHPPCALLPACPQEAASLRSSSFSSQVIVSNDFDCNSAIRFRRFADCS